MGQRILKYWPENPELRELARRGDGEERWQQLSHLASLTGEQPDLAKVCLNLAYANRLAKRAKKKDTKWFILADFREAQILLNQIDDMKELDLSADLEAFGLKFWRGVLKLAHLYKG